MCDKICLKKIIVICFCLSDHLNYLLNLPQFILNVALFFDFHCSKLQQRSHKSYLKLLY